jgi:hypothetical protein
MAQPTKSQTHIDAPLTNISVALMQSPSNFIADRVFPSVGVDKQSNKYFIFTPADFQRDQMRRRGAGEESAGTGYSLSTDTYYCDVFALHKDISDYDRANTDDPLNQDGAAAKLLAHAALLRKEKEFVDTFLTTGVWGTSATPSVQWSDQMGSDPLGDVETAKATILSGTGLEANTIVLGYNVFKALKNHPDLVDRIKYTSERSVTEDVLARLFGVDQVLVAKAVMDSGAEGKSASSVNFVAGNHALICRVEPNAGLEMATAGITFSWKGVNGGMNNLGVVTRKIRIEERLSDRIEIEAAFDMRVLATSLGYFFSSAA